MALLLAGHSDRIDLLGVSTVAGNQSVEKTTINALACLDAFGRSDVQVVRGQGKPLVREAAHCPEIHGDTGLDNREGERLFPKSSRKALEGPDNKCVNVMYQSIQSAGKGRRVKVVAMGALTNVALLLTVYPELVARDEIEVVFMGGAYGLGNTGPVSEFNMQIDPEAAKVVFDSGVKVTMIPLEVTHTALATEEVIFNFRNGAKGAGEDDLAFRDTLCDLLYFFKDTYKSYFGFEHPPLHDPCAVAYVIDPTIFEVEHIRVDVETASALGAGQTVCDRHNLQKKKKNAHVAYRMEVNKFWEMIFQAIGKAAAAKK
jgi:inosine-uridine nucleoside N-ribohydrolase